MYLSLKLPKVHNIQVQTLINGTNRIWTTMNGVNGAKFTSKTDSTKYIFIPAAGLFAGTELTASRSYCYYWYISAAGAGSQASIIRLTDGNFTTSSTMCYYGLPVRARYLLSSYKKV